MDKTIEQLQNDLETILRTKFTVPTVPGHSRPTSNKKNIASVYWTGINPVDRTIWFTVQIIVAKRQILGDLFLEAWKLLVASPDWSPQLPDGITYDEVPLGGTTEADYVAFQVQSNQTLDVLP